MGGVGLRIWGRVTAIFNSPAYGTSADAPAKTTSVKTHHEIKVPLALQRTCALLGQFLLCALESFLPRLRRFSRNGVQSSEPASSDLDCGHGPPVWSSKYHQSQSICAKRNAAKLVADPRGLLGCLITRMIRSACEVWQRSYSGSTTSRSPPSPHHQDHRLTSVEVTMLLWSASP